MGQRAIAPACRHGHVVRGGGGALQLAHEELRERHRLCLWLADRVDCGRDRIGLSCSPFSCRAIARILTAGATETALLLVASHWFTVIDDSEPFRAPMTPLRSLLEGSISSLGGQWITGSCGKVYP